ncbi:MAG: hypothetical protein K0S51_2106 [Bacillales bacterium]|nr:hypothetical protein [Bacillales bacterium]
MIGKYIKTNEIRHFRVDRLREVEETEITFEAEKFDIKSYMPSVFNMYGGETEEEIVRIKVRNKLINVMIDRFGLSMDMRIIDDKWFEIRFMAKVNEGLVKWVLEWGSEVEVIYPISLRHSLRDEIQKMAEIYKD